MKPKAGYFQCPCCKECNDCDAGFQKILDLKNTGLVIYRHISCSDDVNTGVIQFSAKTTEGVFILHNTKDIDLTSADYLPEIEINAIPCPRCRKIVENARKLLEKLPTINRNDVKGICEHCRMKATPCIECKELEKKFVADRTERTENTKEKVKKWISKVKFLLKDSVSEMGREKVRAHSELHIDELCRDTMKLEREPTVRQMFRDDSNFVGAFPPSIEKRKTMFAHSTEKPKRPVAFIDQPEIIGQPSTSRLNSEFNVQDHDIGYYSDVDSEDMRAMFHPALTEEEKQRKSNKEHIPTVPFQSEEDFISGKDDDITSFENAPRQTSPKSHKFNEEPDVDMKDFSQVLYKKELHQQKTLKDYYDSKRHITPARLYNTRNSPDFIRRVHSEETLLSTDASVTGDILNRDFSFVFPKKLSPDIKKLKRQKSSSELIKYTQEMLQAKAEEDKKRLEEEKMRKLEEEEKKRIDRENRRIELAMKKADEEKSRLKLQTQDQEYDIETKSDRYNKETAKIDEKEKREPGIMTPTMEKETIIGTDKKTTAITKYVTEGQKGRPTIEGTYSDDGKKDTPAKKELENQLKLKVAMTKEVEYKNVTGEKDPNKIEKQKGEKLASPKVVKSKIVTDTMGIARKDGVDKQNREKLTQLKKVEIKSEIDYKDTEKIYETEKAGAKHASTVKNKEKQKESLPKETKELQESKESKGLLESKAHKTFKEPKETLELKSKIVKESKELKEVKKLTEPKELGSLQKKEPKELKGPKDAKDHLQPKEVKLSDESKEPKELKGSKESKEPNADKIALKAHKTHEKFKKDIGSKLEKEEKENLKKELEEQLRIEKENKEKEKEFNKRAKHDLTEKKDNAVKLKKIEGKSAAKQKELNDKTKQVKQVTDKKEQVPEVPPPVTVKMQSIKARRISPDDLILRLVRLKQSRKEQKDRTKRLSDMVSGKGVTLYQRRHVADANNMCTASDIDFEAEALHSSKKKEKTPQVIIGEKIYVYKKPKQMIRQDALTKIKEKELRRQLICELAEQKKLQKEIEEAAAKKKKQEDKDALEKKEMEKKEKEQTGLSYLKHINFDAIKVRRPSPDDLILQLVRLKQSRARAEKAKPKRLLDKKLDRKEVKIHKPRQRSARSVSKSSDSELESERTNVLNKGDQFEEIIIGPKISKYKPSKGDRQNVSSAPSFLQSTFDTNQEPVQTKAPESSVNIISGKQVADQEAAKGVIRYALSDRTFIEKGWTMLPMEKVVRKMNVYRMRPAHPEFDWFEHNKNKGMMQYDTGEKLAEFDDDGRGRWFYRNGRMALAYYDAEELNAQQRFVIYSSGEPDERGRAQPYTLIATFDFLGNGVVFDHSGKIRLKYNQTEGVVLDRNIGPVSHWKWHTLNDPPVLQQVMIDTQMAHKDPSILKLGGVFDERVPRHDNEDMLAIEFENFVKEKGKKLTQTFKPFQIKMKALKINEHFSLRVLDQATIYLLFRDGTTNLKLNIGMVLDHKEIVDTDTAEVGEVSTNMERFPARTDSLAGLQRSVAHAQRYERLRTERELKIRPTMSCASVDKLVSAASQPMRAPLRLSTRKSTSTITTDSYCKCSRKPTSSNIYYDTRFC